LLSELNDKKLFPGYEFSSKDKFIARSTSAIQRSILLQNKSLLSQTASRPLDDEEKEILEKHTIYGSISTFKGKEDMKEFKETLAIKREMAALRTRIGEQEASVDLTKEKLSHLKVNYKFIFVFFKDPLLKSLDPLLKSLDPLLKSLQLENSLQYRIFWVTHTVCRTSRVKQERS
jgi:hypothetical protein